MWRGFFVSECVFLSFFFFFFGLARIFFFFPSLLFSLTDHRRIRPSKSCNKKQVKLRWNKYWSKKYNSRCYSLAMKIVQLERESRIKWWLVPVKDDDFYRLLSEPVNRIYLKGWEYNIRSIPTWVSTDFLCWCIQILFSSIGFCLRRQKTSQPLTLRVQWGIVV